MSEFLEKLTDLKVNIDAAMNHLGSSTHEERSDVLPADAAHLVMKMRNLADWFKENVEEKKEPEPASDTGAGPSSEEPPPISEPPTPPSPPRPASGIVRG